MKTSKKALTLDNIGKLIDQKLDQKLAPIDTKITGIYGELDGLKQQISAVDSNLSIKIEVLRKETKEGFDGVYDALDGITHTLDHDLDPKIKRLENKIFAQ